MLANLLHFDWLYIFLLLSLFAAKIGNLRRVTFTHICKYKDKNLGCCWKIYWFMKVTVLCSFLGSRFSPAMDIYSNRLEIPSFEQGLSPIITVDSPQNIIAVLVDTSLCWS